ncbi:unnamed protein product [Penicillium camemberti]|uniref:Str. FM013 n=1 Tax=Penicillium camemberti (strain FM 013) TaxID=1429867 RepID=A0A0G4PX67_PENC3|nr:unnamed protein product [Penicillium camemberti]
MLAIEQDLARCTDHALCESYKGTRRARTFQPEVAKSYR